MVINNNQYIKNYRNIKKCEVQYLKNTLVSYTI